MSTLEGRCSQVRGDQNWQVGTGLAVWVCMVVGWQLWRCPVNERINAGIKSHI